MASSSWRRTLGNVRSFVGNALGGLRGRANLASWAVAGTLAYFLWVKPAQELKREQETTQCPFCYIKCFMLPGLTLDMTAGFIIVLLQIIRRDGCFFCYYYFFLLMIFSISSSYVILYHRRRQLWLLLLILTDTSRKESPFQILRKLV